MANLSIKPAANSALYRRKRGEMSGFMRRRQNAMKVTKYKLWISVISIDVLWITLWILSLTEKNNVD